MSNAGSAKQGPGILGLAKTRSGRSQSGTGEAVFTNRSYRGEEIVRILALNLGGSTDRQELLRNPNRRKKKARKRKAKKKAETRDYRDELPLAARERGPG
jgi:hypothetical protein